MAKRLIPLFNRVLVEKIVPPSKTNTGILLPESSSKLNSGKVIAVGPGIHDKEGKLIPVAVKEGDTVLLPEYGGTEVKLDDKGVLWEAWDTIVYMREEEKKNGKKMVLEVAFLPKMLLAAPVTSLVGKMELHEQLLLWWQMIRCLHILVSNQPPENYHRRFELNCNALKCRETFQGLNPFQVLTCLPSNQVLYDTVVFSPKSLANSFTRVLVPINGMTES
ncbi:unnamed protein product [Sphenostylis stenocarpa]|uniref:Protein groES n=1 Tax=Sphenostylis stenocarpa TaxID=92480 RepID=A0AA86VLS6_9FABA|nr:unnamed protein product [Sphenostylis stenocarpa]